MGSFKAKEANEWQPYNMTAVYRKENGVWKNRGSSIFDEPKYEFVNKTITPKTTFNYVSFGDSIAAGHTINANWDRDYGERSQYSYSRDGVTRQEPTVLVPNCYTWRIDQDLKSIFNGTGITVNTTSFARSGDRVADLMSKLDHALVRQKLAEADLVTICIGANDVLIPSLTELGDYLNDGDISDATQKVAESLTRLNTPSEPNSYFSLFSKLVSINPTAKYVFTSIYNPYKYLKVEEGRNGFIKPALDVLPEISWDFGIAELNFTNFIKDSIAGYPTYKQTIQRLNGLAGWVENCLLNLETILQANIDRFANINSNFTLANTKNMFSIIPNRTAGDPYLQYNDLVSVEFTEGFDVADADWGNIPGWDNNYMGELAWKYLDLSWHGLNLADYFDLDGFMAEFMQDVIIYVIVPDVDPHPEEDGQALMKRAFIDQIGILLYVDEAGNKYPTAVLHEKNPPRIKFPPVDGKTENAAYEDSNRTNQFKPNSHATFADHLYDLTYNDLTSPTSKHTVKQVLPKLTNLYVKHQG